jgi:hypothetical protein
VNHIKPTIIRLDKKNVNNAAMPLYKEGVNCGIARVGLNDWFVTGSAVNRTDQKFNFVSLYES